MKIFGREPALWIAVISALLGLLVTFPLGMSASQSTAIIATVTAGAGAVQALLTRPWSLGLFSGFISSVAVLLAGYGLDVSAETVLAVQLVAQTVLTLIARGQIWPKPEPPDEAREYLANR